MADKAGSIALIPGELSLIFPECIIASDPQVRLVLTVGIIERVLQHCVQHYLGID
ncbi:hypothetical protein MPLSOD_260090 [Mesorhizobium sp. SOD10]|nr:hypothetical protein MPLSOD_260090 [Mesorhizobium sp. SOD10]